MSRFNSKHQQGAKIATINAGVTAALASAGDELLSPQYADQVVSIESADVLAGAASFESVETQLRDVLSNVGISEAELDGSIGLEAASIITMGLGDTDKYHSEATKDVVTASGVNVVSDNAGTVSLESFDRSAIGDFASYSIAFNLEAAQQDKFAETLFPTIVQTPEVGGIDVTIDQVVVHKEVRRNINGAVSDFNKQNVIGAIADHTILESEATKVIPVYIDSGVNENTKNFTASSDITPTVRTIDGKDISTAPLRPGSTLDLLAISSSSPLNNGQALTDEDSLDGQIGISRVYIRVTDATDAGNPKVSVVAINTDSLARSTFYPSPEGEDARAMTLSFIASAIALRSTTTDIAAVPAEALSGLGNQTLTITVQASGRVNLETAELNVHGPSPTASGLYSEDGSEISTRSGAGRAMVDALTFEFIGYDIDATHSNANLRHRDILASNVAKVERYSVGFNAPITAKQPVGDSEKRRATDLKTITAVSRTRTSNDAVTKLLSRAATLEQYANAVMNDMPVPDIEGAGRHLVTPWFKRTTIDVEASIDSNKSHERAADVEGVLINAIRSLAYPMAQDSNYQTALEYITNSNETRPRLIIATSSVIARHLMVTGDERTASIGMDFEVVVSPDNRMKDTIFLTFVRENTKGEADPLSFGCHAWIPEFVSSSDVSTSGSTAKVTTVQTRNRHIALLPVMARIDVVKLEEALKSSSRD